MTSEKGAVAVMFDFAFCITLMTDVTLHYIVIILNLNDVKISAINAKQYIALSLQILAAERLLQHLSCLITGLYQPDIVSL